MSEELIFSGSSVILEYVTLDCCQLDNTDEYKTWWKLEAPEDLGYWNTFERQFYVQIKFKTASYKSRLWIVNYRFSDYSGFGLDRFYCILEDNFDSSQDFYVYLPEVEDLNG